MEINYEITEEECIEAKKILSDKVDIILLKIINPIIFLGLILYSIFTQKNLTDIVISVILNVIILLLAEFIVIKTLLKLFERKLIALEVKKNWKFGKQKIVILDEVMEFSSDMEEYKFYKNEILAIYNIRKYLCIIFNETSNVIVVPKNKVSEESIDAILKLGEVRSFEKNLS